MATSLLVVRDSISVCITAFVWLAAWGYLFAGSPLVIPAEGSGFVRFGSFLVRGTVFAILFSAPPIASVVLVSRLEIRGDRVLVRRVLGILRREYALSDVAFAIVADMRDRRTWWFLEGGYMRIFFNDGSWCIVTGYARCVRDLVGLLKSKGIKVHNPAGEQIPA